MKETDVRALLITAMSFDNRKPGAAMLAAWSDAAERERWTFAEAQEAVKIHYATSTEFLMPGHISQRLRAARQQPQRLPELPAAPPADVHRVRLLVEDLSRRLGWRRVQPADGVDALAVDCPVSRCLAHAGTPCARLATRGKRRGQWLAMAPHPSRRDLAKAMTASD